jgi:hypothetical protein
MTTPAQSTTGLVDRRPALIVRARNADDVVAATRPRARHRARGLGPRRRPQRGGRAVTDGGVMIDLADMTAIAVDPERGTVTAGRRRDLERAQRRDRRARLAVTAA